MCGLFAVYCKSNDPKLVWLFKMLGSLNDSRGGHSYGIWCRDFMAYKALNDFGKDMKGINNYLLTTNWAPEPGNWIAGQTRYATHGAKTVENAHPFEIGDVTLAHNGVVSVYDDAAKHVVDSGQIAETINTNGIVEGLAKVSGSCGLLLNLNDRVLMCYKGGQVLSMVVGDWGYAISSDSKHLYAALEFFDMDYSVVDIPENTVFAPWAGVNVEAPMAERKWDTRTYGMAPYNPNSRWWENDDWDECSWKKTEPKSTSTFPLDQYMGEDGEDCIWTMDHTYHGHKCELCGSKMSKYGKSYLPGSIWSFEDHMLWMCCQTCGQMVEDLNYDYIEQYNKADSIEGDTIDVEALEVSHATD